MAPTIRIDDEVYTWLQSQARPFDDTPNSVLRRISGLEEAAQTKEAKNMKPRTPSVRSNHHSQTPQKAFRGPLLTVLKEHDGEMHRPRALKELEGKLADRLTDYDKSDINSGTVRWEKSAEWEVRVMREEGILKPVSETPRGVWALTVKGWRVASEA
jgi:hypothetical protein